MKELEKKLAELKKEIKALDKTRRYYSVESEWFKMMYPKVLEKETLEAAITCLK